MCRCKYLEPECEDINTCRAPELLRSSAGLSEFSEAEVQKCDVYSFAVILFEIHSRNGPYGKSSLTPKEVERQAVIISSLFAFHFLDFKLGVGPRCTFEPWTPTDLSTTLGSGEVLDDLDQRIE